MTRRILSALAFSVALVLVFAGCGGDDITSGRVTRKDHANARDWIYMQPQYMTICTGSPPSCRQQFSGVIPIPMHEAERWSIHIRNCEGNDGKCRKRRIDVGPQEYEHIELGSEYRVGAA